VASRIILPELSQNAVSRPKDFSQQMNVFLRASLPLLLLLAPLSMHSQAAPSEKEITKRLESLRSVPDSQRGASTGALARDMRTLPAGMPKLRLAVGLSHLATEGDPGRDNLQAVTTTLAMALTETPVPGKNGKPASPYLDLARLTHYEGLTTDMNDPQYTQALAILDANDVDVQKADFTLKDLKGKKVTLSELRGKIVLVNFWATWCPPCRKEMPDLDAIYNHFQSQGLVIVSITDEEMFKVGTYINQIGYKYPILLDPNRKVAQQFHVEGIPRNFVFDREGKLVAQSIDMRTQRQLLDMLAKGGLKPQ
jgi:peroxiredoxin